MISTTVYVEHEKLGLAPTIQTLPEAEIGVVPDVGTDPMQDIYLFWIEAPDFAAVEAALGADPTVAEFTEIIASAERRTYRIRYSEEAILITPAVTELDGLVLESRSESAGWLLEVQLQHHDDLYTLHERASEAGIHFEMLEVHQDDRADDDSEFDLTESQVEALVTAYEHGYYDEPRQTDLAELGSALGVSETAVSSRLRRASSRLIEESLGYDDHDRG
jgi:hypothetical protein